MFSNAKTHIIEYLEQVEKGDFTARCHLTGNGAVESFEGKLKNFYGVNHALCVDSATNGLMYLALAVGLENQEIVTSPLSYGATISGALWLKNKFHFAGIDETLNISPETINDALKENPRIKALYAVDFAGIPHDMLAIRKICDAYGVWYFSDAAQSLGAEIKGMKASSLADAFVVSFSPGKTIFCGEGGCILTNNTDLYKRLVTITQHPYRIKRDVALGISSELALNGRMNPLAAIVGDAVFHSSLMNLKERQQEFLKLYIELDKLPMVKPFRFSEKQILPSFYHLPIMIDDFDLFENELDTENKNRCIFREAKAVLELLPDQLKRMSKSRYIKSFYKATRSILEKLYVFNINNISSWD